jgi:phosphoglycolate phosphatase
MRAVIFDLDHTVFTAENALHQGMIELLTILRRLGVKVGAVSNEDHRALVRLDEAGIRDHFDRVLCSDNAPVPKGVDGLWYLLRLLNAEPYETALVSHAYSDILLGHEAGLTKTIGVAYGIANAAPLHRAGAHHVVEHVSEILDVLE